MSLRYCLQLMTHFKKDININFPYQQILIRLFINNLMKIFISKKQFVDCTLII